VPSLSAAAAVGGGRHFVDKDCDGNWWGGGWGWGYPWYGYYAPGFYGHYGYPFGFSFSFSFGYPYYPYYYYPRFRYWPRYYVAYPYYGYYYSYPYAYLHDYPYYGCDFYDGYYVRFGPYRSSYYVSCSGYGYHAYHHHCHHHACDTHGDHSYHVRDCLECYPSGGSYVYRDVEIPDDAVPVEQAEAPEPVGPPAPPTLAGEADAVPQPLGREESFYASLKPAQLSFVLGLHAMQGGDYDQATESFFNASVEDPDSRLVKVFLAASLFSAGEYRYAAEYIRLGLDGWEEFPSFDWDVRDLYGSPNDFESHLALLETETALDPGDIDSQLVLGFIAMHSGDLVRAGSAFDAVRNLSGDPVELAIASRYMAEVEDRSGAFPRSEEERFELAARADPAVKAFLTSHSMRDVPALPIR
jgi:hypothetical protein